MHHNSHFGAWICTKCRNMEKYKNEDYIEELNIVNIDQSYVKQINSTLQSTIEISKKLNEIIKVVNKITNTRVQKEV